MLSTHTNITTRVDASRAISSQIYSWRRSANLPLNQNLHTTHPFPETVNKNCVPGDRSAASPGGVRIGTPAMTTRGLVEADMVQIGEVISWLTGSATPLLLPLPSISTSPSYHTSRPVPPPRVRDWRQAPGGPQEARGLRAGYGGQRRDRGACRRGQGLRHFVPYAWLRGFVGQSACAAHIPPTPSCIHLPSPPRPHTTRCSDDTLHTPQHLNRLLTYFFIATRRNR